MMIESTSPFFTMVIVGGVASPIGAVLGALYFLGTQWFLPTEWQGLSSGIGVLRTWARTSPST